MMKGHTLDTVHRHGWLRRRTTQAVAVAVGIASSLVPIALLAPSAQADASPPYLTLLFGRAQWEVTDDCATPIPGSVTLQQVAVELQSRGLTGTAAVVTNPTQDINRYCQPSIASHASWSDLAELRDTYGWQSVSTGASHGDMTQMDPTQQYAESCGSLTALEAHGHTRADGLFGYPNDKYNDTMQEDIVSQCYSYGRRYVTPTSPDTNLRATTVAPWYAWSLSVNGGACNVTTEACYDQGALGVNRRYMSPVYIASVMNTLPDEWSIVQTYRFVTGSHAPSIPGGVAWDCSDPNWQMHWTNQAEVYCFDDFKAALDQLDPSVEVTDPETVADDWGRVPPPPDTTNPSGAITSPTQDAQVLPGPMTITGTATDNAAVAAVDVYVKNRDTQEIWHNDGSWSLNFQWQSATLANPGSHSTNWTFNLPTIPNGNYSIGFRVRDTSGNLQGGTLIRFVVSTAQPDTTKPSGLVLFPTQDAQLTPGAKVISGQASDNVGVTNVDIYVKNRDTGQLWQANNTWSSTFAWHAATIAAPGTQMTTWSFNLPQIPLGNYSIGLRVKDAAANTYTAPTLTRFVITNSQPDTQAPVGTITSPTQDQSLLQEPITFQGTATDNVSVSVVDVYVKNRTNNTFWQTNNTFTTQFTWHPVQMAAPGSTSTSWTFNIPAIPAGNYAIGIRAKDPSNNLHTGTIIRFSVVQASDTGITAVYENQLGGPLHYDIYPSGIDMGPDGNIVIADTGNDMVKKYTRAGTLVWAVGGFGYGVGQFYEPRDVAIDSANNVYVVDTRNSRIVKLDANGNWVKSWEGPANDKMSFPLGLSTHNDQVILADLGKKKIRVFDTEGNQLQAFGGSGAACSNLNGIRDAERDNAGNFYVAGYSTNTIIKFDPSGNCLLAWGGTGTQNGKFKTPYGVKIAVDPVLGTEAVYVADALNNRMQEFTLTGSFVTKFGTFGTWDQPGTFDNLRRVTVDTNGTGDVWVADLWGDRVAQWHRTPSGYTYVQQWGNQPPPTTDTEVFHEPHQVAFDLDGNLRVMDTVHHRIVTMSPTGQVLGTCGRRGSAQGQFNWPRGIAVDPVTGQLWVADTKANRIQILNPNCTFVQSFGSLGTGPAQFNWPSAIAIRNDGIAFIADTQNNRVKAYNVATRALIGTFLTVGAGQNQAKGPLGIAIDPTNNHVYVGDTQNNRLIELQTANGVSWSVVRYISGYLSGPENMAVDSAGRLFATDSNNNRIALIAQGGGLDHFIDSPPLYHPASVTIGPDGKIYVTDTQNDRILVYREEAD
jgi:DNA-binding beta-propeller fold protein YncE